MKNTSKIRKALDDSIFSLSLCDDVVQDHESQNNRRTVQKICKI